MLIHSWDASLGDDEWREWVANRELFGVLSVSAEDASDAPLAVPAHVTILGNEILLHLANPNDALPRLRVVREATFTLFGDYAYIPGYWRNQADVPPENGVPTSYYSAVVFTCRPTIVDDPDGIAEIIRVQMEHLQPEGGTVAVIPDKSPFGPMLGAVTGVRLAIVRADAKFKFDDHKSIGHRNRVSDNLRARDYNLDQAAAEQQQRRLRAKDGESS